MTAKSFLGGLVYLAFTIFSGTVRADNISGKLVNNEGAPVDFANVVALAQDTTFIAGTVTETNGEFDLTAENPAFININILGYESRTIPYTGNSQMGEITLNIDQNLLSEVVVKNDHPLTKLKGTALVTNIAGTYLSKLPNADEVMQWIPGVAGEKGRYSVFGKGAALIYVNNRRLFDPAEFRNINAANIASIEVLRNPGSSYPPGTKAVIIVKTMRPQGEGFSGNVSTMETQATYFSTANSLTANYRRGSFDVSASVDYSHEKGRYDNELNISNFFNGNNSAESTFHRFKNVSDNLSTRAFVNYYFNKNHIAGARYSFGYQTTNITGHGNGRDNYAQ